MSSDLINLIITEYEKYKTTKCDQAEKNIKEYFNLIQQDLDSIDVFIIYKQIYDSRAQPYLYSISFSSVLWGIEISGRPLVNLNKYELVNDVYIYRDEDFINIMTKEMYEKILNSLNNSKLLSYI
jgi:hypothetical protein